MKVLVGLSGGPDSLVTAWLLKKQGMQLRGVFFDLKSSETGLQKIQQLERKLGISILIVNVAAEFENTMALLQTEASLDGQQIKLKDTFHRHCLFPKLMELKEHHQFDQVATGHRVLLREDQVAQVVKVFQSENPGLDEAELLLGLSQLQLKSLILPLGSIPEAMLQKLALELAAGKDENEWEGLKELRTFSTLNFEVHSASGASQGLAKDPQMIPGMKYESLNNPGVNYRVTDVSYLDQRITVAREQQLLLSEIIFEDCFWYGRGDLKFPSLECGLRSEKHLNPIRIKLLQYAGNRLKGYLLQPLKGEEANIFKGETVLWIEGAEILGGGRVFRTT